MRIDTFLSSEYVEVTENMQEVSVVLGRNIRFMCGVTTLSGIEVTFQWDKFYSAVPIVSNRHIRVWRKDTKNELLSTSEMRGYLEINGAQYSDGGPYRCQAIENTKELFSKEAFLKVLGKAKTSLVIMTRTLSSSYLKSFPNQMGV